MASDYVFDIFTPLAIVLPVLPFMASDYVFDIFKPLAIVLPVLQFMASDYQYNGQRCENVKDVIRSHELKDR
jgi:hypothetical protein